jgi:outer membrane protein OmpA-like peptidoglycan-associated protein
VFRLQLLTAALALIPALAPAPALAQSCDDGQKNGTETDVDCGGLCAPCSLGEGCSTNTDCLTAQCVGLSCVTPCSGATDPEDCDGDGLPNIIEDKNGNGVKDSDETDASNGDTDYDGLSDGKEDKDKDGVVDPNESDPKLWDTDGGGENDGAEVAQGRDPLNPNDDFGASPDAGVDTGPVQDLGTPDTGAPDLPDAAPDITVPDAAPDITVPDAAPDITVPDASPDQSVPDAVSPDMAPDGPLGDQATPDGPPSDSALDRSVPDSGVDPGVDSRPGVEGGLKKDDLFLYGSGGCFCEVHGGARRGGWGVLLVMALLVLALAARRRKKPPLLLLLLLLTLWADRARAETLLLPVDRFQPAASTLNFFVTEGSETLPHLVPSVGLYLSYVHSPLELWSESRDRTVSEVIRYRVNMDLLIALGLGHSFEIGVALPTTLAQDSDESALRYELLDAAAGPGIGDLRLSAKVHLMRRGPVGLAAALTMGLPSGSRENLLGADGVSFVPRAIVSVDTRVLDIGFNIGFRIRNKQNVTVSSAQEQVTVNDDLLLSLAARVPLVEDHLDLVVDSFMAVAVDEQDEEEIPLEVMAGLRYTLPAGFTLNVGAGPGLTRGIGTPGFRLLAGLGYQYTPAKPPPREEAPAETDHDGDGLLHGKDMCPVEPEDKDGFEDNDGCPDPDNDGDGVLDGEDRCPLEPEDRDEYEDDDGCPDPDNDGDGVPDLRDKCPLEPEDKDGFEDADGCPDQDNDGDGIPDITDRCPQTPETVNGVDDDDGCPDEAAGPVKIQRGAIHVAPVFFATGRDVIRKKSEATLKLVAETLGKHGWIKKVRIEGHTDDRGKPANNRALSLRRAQSVLYFLVQSGVDAARLEVSGLGSDRPIADNRTRAGRAKNRRVEFIIVDPPQPPSFRPASSQPASAPAQ